MDTLTFATMAPHAIEDIAVDNFDKKVKVVVTNVEVEAHPPPPVADNFMYDFKYNAPLPTSDVLGTEIPHDCDAQKEADAIVTRLSEVLSTGDAGSFANLFLESGKLHYYG